MVLCKTFSNPLKKRRGKGLFRYCDQPSPKWKKNSIRSSLFFFSFLLVRNRMSIFRKCGDKYSKTENREGVSAEISLMLNLTVSEAEDIVQFSLQNIISTYMEDCKTEVLTSRPNKLTWYFWFYCWHLFLSYIRISWQHFGRNLVWANVWGGHPKKFRKYVPSNCARLYFTVTVCGENKTSF